MFRIGLIALVGVIVTGQAAFAACEGDLNGFWEKRPVGSDAEFVAIQTFRIDSKTGSLSLCERDLSWDSDFSVKGDSISFVFPRRMRHLSKTKSGSFLTESWIAESEGTTSEYRVRVETN